METSNLADLEGSNFSNVEFKYLCIGLYNNTSVSTLNLGYCGLDDYCAEELSELLIRNKTIRTLELTNNNITNVGALEIVKALADNTTLTTLSLSYNRIDSFKDITKYLSSNTTLTRIEINGNIRSIFKYSEYYYGVIFNIVKRNNIYLWYKPSVDTFNSYAGLPDEINNLVIGSILQKITK
jgi:hypothetical protein